MENNDPFFGIGSENESFIRQSALSSNDMFDEVSGAQTQDPPSQIAPKSALPSPESIQFYNPPTDEELRLRLQQQRQNAEIGLTNSIRAAAQNNPDAVAEARKIARTLGVSESEALQNADVLRKLYQQETELNALRLASSPVLQYRMTDPQFAQITYDKIGELVKEESLWQKIKEANESAGLIEERGMIASKIAADIATPVERLRLKAINKRMEEIGPVEGFIAGGTELVSQVIRGLFYAAPGAAVGGAAGSVIPGVGTATGAIGGAITAGFAYSAMLEGGNAYADLVEEGVDHEIAATAALGVGVIAGAVEVFGAKIAAAPIKKMLAQKLTKKVSEALADRTSNRALKELGKDYLKGMAGEVSTEAVQEIIQIIGEEYARDRMGWESKDIDEQIGRVVDIMQKVAVGMTLPGLPMPMVRFIGDQRRATKAEKTSEMLQSIVAAANDSTVKARDGETYAQHLLDQSKNSGAENVYIDAKELSAALNKVGMTEDEFKNVFPESMGTDLKTLSERGEDVVIPTSHFLSRLDRTDLQDILKNHMRFDKMDSSFAEAETFRKNEQQFREDAEKQVALEDEAETQFQTELSDIHDNLLQAAKSSGTVNDRKARAVASVYRAWVNVSARKAKMMPKEFQQKYGIKVGMMPAAEQRTVGEEFASPQLTFLHGSKNENLTLEDIKILGRGVAEGQRQGKRNREYGGFYTADISDIDQAKFYADQKGQKGFIYSVTVKPDAKIYQKDTPIDRLAKSDIDNLVSQGYSIVSGKDVMGKKANVIIDKSAILSIDKYDPNAMPKAGGEVEGTFQQFAGESAQTADKPALAKAEEMIANGVSAEEVAKQTGWMVGLDGLWRFEISDKNMEFNNPFYSMDDQAKEDYLKFIEAQYASTKQLVGLSQQEKDDLISGTAQNSFGALFDYIKSKSKSGKVTLSKLIDHKKLFDAYPQLKDLEVISENSFGFKGYFRIGRYVNESLISLSPAYAYEDVLSTLAHEIQHAIQTIEGFDPGGSREFIEATNVKEASRLLAKKVASVIGDSGDVSKHLPRAQRKPANAGPLRLQAWIDDRSRYELGNVLIGLAKEQEGRLQSSFDIPPLNAENVSKWVRRVVETASKLYKKGGSYEDVARKLLWRAFPLHRTSYHFKRNPADPADFVNKGLIFDVALSGLTDDSFYQELSSDRVDIHESMYTLSSRLAALDINLAATNAVEIQLISVYGKTFNEIAQDSLFDAYKRISGEAEARLVQTRFSLSDEERRDNYGLSKLRYGLDVDPNEIVRLGVPAKMMMELGEPVVGTIEEAKARALKSGIVSVRNTKKFFGELWPTLLKSTGKQLKFSPKNFSEAARLAVADVAEFVRNNPKFADYYTNDWKLTRAILDDFYGRKITDEEFLLFRTASGLCSPNTKLAANQGDAVTLLHWWVNNGNFDAFKMGVSKKGNAVLKDAPVSISGTTKGIKLRTMKIVERLTQELGSIEKAIEHLKEPVPVAELHKFKKQMGYKGRVGNIGNIVTLVEQATGQNKLIPRMFIFGQKVGAYTLNAIGDSRFTTIDIWESRFIRSYFTGMFKKNTGLPVDVTEHDAFARFNEVFKEEFEKLNPGTWSKSALQAIRWFYILDAAKKSGYSAASTNETISYYTERKLRLAYGFRAENPSGGATRNAARRARNARDVAGGGIQASEAADGEFRQPVDGGGAGVAPEGEPQRKPSRASYRKSDFTMFLRGEGNVGERSDFSSWLHEFSHHFLNVSMLMAAEPDAHPDFLRDAETLLNWFGIEPSLPIAERIAKWNAMSVDEQRPHHEAWAYNWEIWINSGTAPSSEMRTLFEKFKVWMVEIYTDIVNTMNREYRKEFGRDLPALTPEVRMVMERMIASERAIQHASKVRMAIASLITLKDAQMFGMDKDEWDKYQKLDEEQKLAMTEVLMNRSFKEMQWLGNASSRHLKDLQRLHADLRKKVRAEVAEQVEGEAVYRLRNWFRTGKITLERPEEIEMGVGETMESQKRVRLQEDLVRPYFSMLSDEAWASMSSTTTAVGGQPLAPLMAKEGLDPVVVLGMFPEFKSVQQMLAALMTAAPIEEEIDARTDARMLAEYGDLQDPKSQQAVISEALHDEARTRFVAQELAFMARVTEPVRILMAAAREVARSIIGNKKVRDALRVYDHEIAETRAAKRVVDAIKNGDKDGAITAKRQQLVQHELTKQSAKVREEIETRIDSFAKVFKQDATLAKRRNMAIVNAARAILTYYGLGQAGVDADVHAKASLDMDAKIYTNLLPLIDAAKRNAKDYRDMTVTEFRVMRETIEELWHESRRENIVQLGEKLMELAKIETELLKDLNEKKIPDVLPGETRARTAWETRMQSVLKLRALGVRVETWCEIMGPSFTKYIWRPVKDALNEYRALRNKKIGQLEKMFIQLGESARKEKGTIDAIEAIGYELGKANGGYGILELVGMLLHMGNESNRRKFFLGRVVKQGTRSGQTWGVLQKDGTIDTSSWDSMINGLLKSGKLKEEHLDWVQSVWDMLEDMKPMLQRAHYDMFGYHFVPVEAKPFTVTFADGRTKEYRGGYFPAKTDKLLDYKANERESVQEAMADFKYAMPATESGFLEERVNVNRPLSFDLNLMVKHVDDVVKFAMVQPTVSSVLKILNRDGFIKVLNRYDSTAYNEILIPWLNRAVQQSTSKKGSSEILDGVLDFLRNNAATSIMFGSVSNTLQNLTGFFVAATKISPIRLAKSLMDYLFVRTEEGSLASRSCKMSKWLDNRLKNQIFDMRQTIGDVIVKPNMYQKIDRWVKKHTYFMQRGLQNIMDVVVWDAAFNQYMEENGKSKSDTKAVADAIAAADSAVRKTQNSYDAEDLAQYEINTPLGKTLTQFSGYFNMLANLNAENFQKLHKKFGKRMFLRPETYMMYMLGFGLPMFIGDAIARAIAGNLSEDDDEDDSFSVDAFQFFLGSQVRGMAAMLPGFGPNMMALYNAFNDKTYDDRVLSGPAVTYLERLYRGTRRGYDYIANDEELNGYGVRDIITLLSIPLPGGAAVPAVARPAYFLQDLANGEAESSGSLDYLRGLLSGKVSTEGKQ